MRAEQGSKCATFGQIISCFVWEKFTAVETAKEVMVKYVHVDYEQLKIQTPYIEVSLSIVRKVREPVVLSQGHRVVQKKRKKYVNMSRHIHVQRDREYGNRWIAG